MHGNLCLFVVWVFVLGGGKAAPVFQDESQWRWVSYEDTVNIFGFVGFLKGISEL